MWISYRNREDNLMPPTRPSLLEAIPAEGRRATFPVDRPVYERGGRDPLRPILVAAGSREAPGGFVARDPGKAEVAAAQVRAREDRYDSAERPCVLEVGEVRQPVLGAPLPRPSPFHQRWYPRFPGPLTNRLAAVRAAVF